MKIALVPSAPCEWRAAGRLLGRVELSPLEDGPWFGEFTAPLEPLDLVRIWHAADELSAGLAKRIAKRFGGSAKEADELAEVNLGLWAGLTEEELKKRFSSAYRQLYEDPLSVHPPNGETLSDAVERIRKGLSKRLKKPKNTQETTVLVLRPLVFALTRSLLEGGDMRRFWEQAEAPDATMLLEADPAVLSAAQPKSKEKAE